MGFRGVKKLILKLTPKKILRIYRETPLMKEVEPFSRTSYSQEGEDLILDRIFERVEKGFYVDVGAHHPQRFSNTYLFYKRGWRGINIDAMPGSMAVFNEIRPEDTNIEFAISDKVENRKFYIFNEGALNTFSKTEANRKNGLGDYKIVEEVSLLTYTLADVLEKYKEPNRKIDFISVDVEGFDLNVLRSLDWSKNKPKVILVEEFNADLENLNDLKTYKFLSDKGYSLFAKTFNTLIFRNGEL